MILYFIIGDGGWERPLFFLIFLDFFRGEGGALFLFVFILLLLLFGAGVFSPSLFN